VQITRERCPACGAATDELPAIRSDFSDIEFAFRRCEDCGLSFVANPRVDFAELYDSEYYAGRGADSFVDYVNEMENSRTVREYEWRGISRAVEDLTGRRDVTWLDYGCGLGGLVRYARRHGFDHVFGFDEGFSASWMAQHGIPVLSADELATREGQFDIVTAIEVVEHVTDPVAVMSHITSLLKPGGLFLLTTGNAEPHRGDLTTWSYVHPDIHIAYYEPRTLEALYRRCGLEPYPAGFVTGLDDIIRYKVLKTVGLRSRNVVERIVPWSIASRIVDRRHKVSAQPFARRPCPSANGQDGPVAPAGGVDEPSQESFLYVGDLVDIDARDLPAMKAKFLVERVPNGSRLLEVGCGGGKMLRTVAYHRTGVELFGCDVKRPVRSDDFTFTLVRPGDANLPYEDASKDVILMIDVLEHVHDPVGVLSEAARVLAPGGRLLAFVPVEGQPLSWYAVFRFLLGRDLYVETKEHVQAFRRADVDELFATDFDVSTAEYAYHPLGQFMDAALCAGLKFGPLRRLFWSSSPYHGTGGTGNSAIGRAFGKAMVWANGLAWAESRLLRRVRLGSAGVMIDARRRTTSS
jgi:2-polyprenyl-3-methyl-5-hydroxy-6-metoxy-1,4-benzoquinol methylase